LWWWRGAIVAMVWELKEAWRSGLGWALLVDETSIIVLRAADRYAYTDCGSTAYCYLFYWGRANTYTHKKTLSVENLSRANSWSLSSCACPAGSCPAGSFSS